MALTGMFESSSARKLNFFKRNNVTNPRVKRYIYMAGN